MTKNELINELATHNRLGSKAAATEVLDTIIELISNAVVAGDEVYLGQSFGGFVQVTKSARTARNPQTGEAIKVPAKKAVKFKPSAALKAKVAA